jgi:uncharacterized membrane protein
MSTASAPLPRAPWLSSKTLVFTFIVMMFAYVLWHNERFLIDAADPEWKHIAGFRWWLLPHGLAAACALLLGPMQFFDRLRQRYAKLHRVVGRIYVAGALIGAPLGAYIQYFQERHMGSQRSFSVAAAVDAALWMTTTAIGLFFAVRRQIPQHRQWMTRSYAVAIVFLEVRVILGVTGWERLGPRVVETVVWFCVAFAVLFGDIAVQWQEMWRSRPKVAKARAIAA